MIHRPLNNFAPLLTPLISYCLIFSGSAHASCFNNERKSIKETESFNIPYERISEKIDYFKEKIRGQIKISKKELQSAYASESFVLAFAETQGLQINSLTRVLNKPRSNQSRLEKKISKRFKKLVETGTDKNTKNLPNLIIRGQLSYFQARRSIAKLISLIDLAIVAESRNPMIQRLKNDCVIEA